MKRRAWILGGTLAAGGAAGWVYRRRSLSRTRHDPDRVLKKRSGPFAVREGFECRVISKAGDPLSDGARSADLPDGMACFELEDGKWALLRNHELMSDPTRGAYPAGQPPEAYRPGAHGGVSRLVIQPKTLEVLSSNMVLTGTQRNCAGGPSPWGWITCEETMDTDHGYAFLCRSGAGQLRPPERITAYGRFRHEAVALDPETKRAFLTEDEPDGCLYRFTPSGSAPFEGQLEALRVVGESNFDTGARCETGRTYPVDWVPIEEIHAKTKTLRAQAQAQGAALIKRGEGAWLDGDGVVFSSTSGGKHGAGQIYRLSFETDELRLVAEADGEALHAPDNITVAPWGDLVVAEDNLLGVQQVLGVTRDGHIYPILRNELSRSELAGVCFSPDGSTLFCNVQHDGLTVAIRGPWDTLREIS